MEGTSLEVLFKAGPTLVRYRLHHIAQGLHQSSSEYLEGRGLTDYFLTSNQNSPCCKGCLLPVFVFTMHLQEGCGSVFSLATH